MEKWREEVIKYLKTKEEEVASTWLASDGGLTWAGGDFVSFLRGWREEATKLNLLSFWEEVKKDLWGEDGLPPREGYEAEVLALVLEVLDPYLPRW